jgi:diguanylate cyclase (GGDEF)-like protein
VTLRARLTVTFLGVVLGPVLLAAVFVGITATELARDRADDRLAAATSAVRAELGARCDRLESAATAAALLAAEGRTPVVAAGATSIVVADAGGAVTAVAGPPAPATWADCSGSAEDATGSAAFGIRVERRDQSGTLLGYAQATAPADDALIQALASAGGVSVRVGRTADGNLHRHLARGAGQPLDLVLSTEPASLYRLYGLLGLVVAAAAVMALVAAWWLARSTTRPLADLVHAAERVAAGDLNARVLHSGPDEVGRLGATFNRMTQEMRSYVRALTASRDQLRNHLALLGDTLSGTHDVARILHVTLHSARSATGAQAGVVLLLDPATGMLVTQCAVGAVPNSPTLAGMRLAPGEGLLGAVADSGVPAHGRASDSRFSPSEPRATTFIAVPVALPEPVTPLEEAGTEPARGVLALYDRVGPDGFDEADVSTLTTFAAQAAIALDNVRLHEEAQRLSLTDPLTGLFNYRYLRESLRREMERAARFGRTLALVALDLDHFKDVNDTWGHAVGDLVLVEIARRIRSVTREVDVAFRRGGEEFVVLLPETDAAGGSALARRLAVEVRDTPVLARDHMINVTVSIGVAVYPEHGSTGAAVLEAADIALYAAKAAGRDACRVADARRPPGLAIPARRPEVASLGDKPTVAVASLGDKPTVAVASLGDKSTVAVPVSDPAVPVTGVSRGAQPAQRVLGG